MSTPYNGWTNYPTWLTFTWLSNDEDTYTQALLAMCSGASAAASLRAFAEDQVLYSDAHNGYRHDLGRWALDQVDFEKVAAALME